MTDQPKPVVFRLYPEPNSSLFCRVNVWADKAAMMAHWRSTRGRKAAAHFSGAVALATGRDVYLVAGTRVRKTGEFCEINCHRQNLDVEIVVHETNHACFRWASRVGLEFLDPEGDGDLRDCSPAEERFCYALGRMTDQFVRSLQRRRVWSRLPLESCRP